MFKGDSGEIIKACSAAYHEIMKRVFHHKVCPRCGQEL